jgi:hypothetical protein
MAGDGVRRVVTGTSAGGRSVVASDGPVRPVTPDLMPGAEFYALWGADTPPAFPDDGTEPAFTSWFPPPAGYRFEVITIPPDATPRPAGLDIAAATTEVERTLPGLLGAMEKDEPGMHRTDTVDLIYVLAGQCVMRLDDGVTVALSAGDTVIQNGARHGWRVPYVEPCRLLCVSIGGVRKS